VLFVLLVCRRRLRGPVSLLCARSGVIRRVADMLSGPLVADVGRGCVPSWHMFGSSANGFGLDGSDIDLCVVWTDGHGRPVPEPISPRDFVVRVGQLLTDDGTMTNVTVRDSARIPIVQFHDPASGLDVDLCGIVNFLAIRNTQLLRTYSLCDARVVPLALFIKNWCVTCLRRWYLCAALSTPPHRRDATLCRFPL
jgi:hypothetical protein